MELFRWRTESDVVIQPEFAAPRQTVKIENSLTSKGAKLPFAQSCGHSANEVFDRCKRKNAVSSCLHLIKELIEAARQQPELFAD